MQSSQENILKTLLDRSLGADYMFLPKKYMKGSAQKEPCDLAFWNDGLAVLFYATASEQAIEQQVQHNLIQAEGYLRLWKRGETRYVLRGTYATERSAYVRYKDVNCLVTVSIVSAQCGVIVHSVSHDEPIRVSLTIPQQLILSISTFRGTVVDLLAICARYQETVPATENHDENFKALQSIADSYVAAALIPAFDVTDDAPSSSVFQTIDFILSWFATMRSAKSMSRGSSCGMAPVFGDMALHEIASFAAASHRLLRYSGEEFERYGIVKLIGNYYEVWLVTINMAARNDVLKETLELMKDSPHALLVIFANLGGINDLRVPVICAEPKAKTPLQALSVIRTLRVTA